MLEKRIEIMLKEEDKVLSSFDFQLTEFSEINVKKDNCKVIFFGVVLIHYWSPDEYEDDFEFNRSFEPSIDNDSIEIERQMEIDVSSEFALDITSLTISNINIEI